MTPVPQSFTVNLTSALNSVNGFAQKDFAQKEEDRKKIFHVIRCSFGFESFVKCLLRFLSH